MTHRAPASFTLPLVGRVGAQRRGGGAQGGEAKRPNRRARIFLALLLALAPVSLAFAAADKEPPPAGSFAGAPPQFTKFTAPELERGFMALAFGSDLRIGARP